MEFRERLESRLREYHEFNSDDLLELEIQILDEYSGLKPRYTSSTYTATESKVYTYPSDWDSSFSTIDYIEYPLASILLEDNPNNYPIPSHLENSDYILQSSQFLLLYTIDVGEQFDIRYRIPYTIDTMDSVPRHHRGAIMNLATAYGFAKLASDYSQGIDYNPPRGENVDNLDVVKEYLKQADWYRDKWEQAMHLGKYANTKSNDITETDDSCIEEKSLYIDRPYTT